MIHIFKIIYSSLKYTIRNLKSEWGILLLTIVPVILTVPIDFIQNFINLHWIIPIIGFGLIIVGLIQSNYQKENKEKVMRDNDFLKERISHVTHTLESIPIDFIKILYRHWEFEYQDRITIYRYEKDNFVQVGRHSINVELRRNGRDKYPKDEGFISKAWQNGIFYIENLPKFQDDPEAYLDETLKVQRINKGTIRNISMKSRSYYCRNLTNQDNDPIAVIVIESLSPKLPVDSKELGKDLEGTLGQYLVKSIETNLPIGRGHDYE